VLLTYLDKGILGCITKGGGEQQRRWAQSRPHVKRVPCLWKGGNTPVREKNQGSLGVEEKLRLNEKNYCDSKKKKEAESLKNGWRKGKSQNHVPSQCFATIRHPLKTRREGIIKKHKTMSAGGNCNKEKTLSAFADVRM